jgi:hypothetical protein
MIKVEERVHSARIWDMMSEKSGNIGLGSKKLTRHWNEVAVFFEFEAENCLGIHGRMCE